MGTLGGSLGGFPSPPALWLRREKLASAYAVVMGTFWPRQHGLSARRNANAGALIDYPVGAA